MTNDARPPTTSTPPPGSTSSGEVRPVLRPIPGWVIAVGIPMMLLVAIGAVWLMLGVGMDSTKLDVIRTGGTLGVGLGGVLVLWLAIRRQRSTELDLLAKYEAHELAERTAANTLAHQQAVAATTQAHQEQVAADARILAAARRITELYLKAAELLGSDKAPVRLSGLYALERLAQDNETQRQTIVNVLCAYLRMPYELTEPPPGHAGSERHEQYRALVQEREVRLTAQRLLGDHLQPDLGTAYWGPLDLDLVGAQLIDFNLNEANIGIAHFGHAIFTGPTTIADTTFTEIAMFNNVIFNDLAWFDGTKFANLARFPNASFGGTAWFRNASFEHADFDNVSFNGSAWFNDCDFSSATFSQATFSKNVTFDATAFSHHALFGKTAFTGQADFVKTNFSGVTSFEGAAFASPPSISQATCDLAPDFGRATLAGKPYEPKEFTSADIPKPSPAD
ncbi:pentapeptide repeat-containing protein [Amycolatopsis sp. WAC 01376]|uniref:pentapeptide repeat-containing protein n=1 Tax=Amycolatopsis sp. WAC 01376 TaxID=2203195 RepID=UPI0013154A71|nr:pentapeptide repeat-containing protein [Amycolatopsis sp. WAC 01376]